MRLNSASSPKSFPNTVNNNYHNHNNNNNDIRYGRQQRNTSTISSIQDRSNQAFPAKSEIANIQ